MTSTWNAQGSSPSASASSMQQATIDEVEAAARSALVPAADMTTTWTSSPEPHRAAALACGGRGSGWRRPSRAAVCHMRLLLQGPVGVGKEQFAAALAAALVCTGRGERLRSLRRMRGMRADAGRIAPGPALAAASGGSQDDRGRPGAGAGGATCHDQHAPRAAGCDRNARALDDHQRAERAAQDPRGTRIRNAARAGDLTTIGDPADAAQPLSADRARAARRAISRGPG